MFTALITLFLTVAAIYVITVVLAIALVALINAYYAIKERIVNSHVYKVFRILIKRLRDRIEQIVVVVGPDGNVMEEQQSESFTAEDMKGTAIEKAFEEADRKPDSKIDGDTAIKWDPTKKEESELKRKAGR